MGHRKEVGTSEVLLFVVFVIVSFFAVIGACRVASGQTTTVEWRDTVICVPMQYPIFTKKTTEYKDSIVYVQLPCDSMPVDSGIVIPEPYEAHSMYVSPIGEWMANPRLYLNWAKNQGVNELNLYARAYITSTSKHSQMAEFVRMAKEEYGMKKIRVDYRLTSELPYWQIYCDRYKGTSSTIDALITEREPYVTGDYSGFWPFLRLGHQFVKANGMDMDVYMGHPTQQGWDSIIYYSDQVFLSLYITMGTWGNSTNGYNYVNGRWTFISNSATKQGFGVVHSSSVKSANALAAALVRAGKSQFPVQYILSLERKIWGAGNDFMGEWFANGHSFYGSTLRTVVSQYEANASVQIKNVTDLVGVCIFYSKYALLAHPIGN